MSSINSTNNMGEQLGAVDPFVDWQSILDGSAWSYLAKVAEALIVVGKSRGIFVEVFGGRNMGVSKNNGFSTQIIHFNRVFHYKPSILRYHYFWKHQFYYT